MGTMQYSHAIDLDRDFDEVLARTREALAAEVSERLARVLTSIQTA